MGQAPSFYAFKTFQNLQINEQNKLFNEGKATFFEKLNENSDLPMDIFEEEKEGEINISGRSVGEIDIDESEWFTHEDLQRLYRSVNRGSIPANYDARTLGNII
jgi:hypothetical protein